MKKNKKNQLPSYWTTSPLRKLLIALESGKRPRGGVKNIKTGVPSIGGEHLNANGGFKFAKIKYVPEEFADRMVRGHIQKNDILIVKDGATTGKTSLVRESFPHKQTVINEHVFLCRCAEEINPLYLFYYLFSSEGNQQILKDFRGAAQGGISQGFADIVTVPIAPQNEQKRISAEIEKQFSRLDEAVDSLKRVKTNLKRYKASVLKAAVEGKLTEEWREKHPDVEPADKLLQRILAERRKKCEEAELAKMKAKGKVPKDDKWKKKYKEPEKADQIDMEIPNGWVSATVKQLAERVQYGSSSKTNEDSNGISVLRMGNIFEGKLLLNKLKYLPKSHDEFPELLLEPDDLLFNWTNSPELVGKTAVYKGNPSACSFASYLIRVRFINGVDPNFISYFINSNYGRIWIKSVVSQQVGQANVNGTKLQALSVPLPPYLEQNEIVSEVENKISIIDGIEKEVEGNLIRAERLRQSILKKAFSGRLIRA